MSHGPNIYILRHGQAIHNVDRSYAHRDPPLTDEGVQQAEAVKLAVVPDLILISPMTRALQTSLIVFKDLLSDASPEKHTVEVQIWPELRETHDHAICNQGVTKAELEAKFPQFGFGECHSDWDYERFSHDGATERAERVRARLKEVSRLYENVVVVCHRGFIKYLVGGEIFKTGETKSYRIGPGDVLEETRDGK